MSGFSEHDPVMAWLARATYRERRRFLRKNIKPAYPRFLYRYIAGNPADDKWATRLRDVLVKSRLWLSTPVDFNDPFDMKGQVRVGGDGKTMRERIERILKVHRPELSWKSRKAEVQRIMGNSPEKLPALLQGSLDDNLSKVGVCSFSTDARNIQMWSHYASHHRSIVLQFEVARDGQAFLRALPVKYDDEYPVVNWFGDSKNDLRGVLLRKHPGWQNECEWRIIEIDRAQTYMPFQQQALTGLVLGCRADDKVRAAVEIILRERAASGAPPIKVYEANRHPSRFKICVGRVRSFG
jgi:Protein of unknown function (DUF2971)